MRDYEDSMGYENSWFIIDAGAHYQEVDPYTRTQCKVWLNGDMPVYELSLRIASIAVSIGHLQAERELEQILRELFHTNHEQVRLCKGYIESIVRMYLMYLVPLLNTINVQLWEVRIATIEEMVIDEWFYGNFRFRLNYPKRHQGIPTDQHPTLPNYGLGKHIPDGV